MAPSVSARRYGIGENNSTVIPMPADLATMWLRSDVTHPEDSTAWRQSLLFPSEPLEGGVKIREIRCAGLRGATPKGGWSNELRPEDCVHTLVAVHTDEGLVGLGSVFSNDALVKAALAVLEPLYRGENALEPERVSEKLHQHMFWLGRGGSITHAISGIDIALWDLLGQATGQPVGRLLGGRYRERVRPYASVLMEERRRRA